MATPEEQARLLYGQLAGGRAGAGMSPEERAALLEATQRGLRGAVSGSPAIPGAVGGGIPYPMPPRNAPAPAPEHQMPSFPGTGVGGGMPYRGAFDDAMGRPVGGGRLPSPASALTPTSEAAFTMSNVPSEGYSVPAPKRGGAPAAASVTEKPVTAAQDPINPYQSKNPTSVFDKDIEFTHTLSRMLGMAGLPQAQGSRDLNLKLQMARIDNIAEKAQRAFIAGDVTTAIDAFNHVVPNGQQITGYRKNPDGTYAFQMQDGSIETRSADDVMGAITTFRDPAVYGQMLINRAKAQAEMNTALRVANLKGQWSYEEALAKGMLDNAGRLQLEEAKRRGEMPKFFQQIGGETYLSMQTPTGPKGYQVKMVVNPMTGKKEQRMVEIDVPYASIFGGGAGGVSSGTVVNPNLIPIAPGLR